MVLELNTFNIKKAIRVLTMSAYCKDSYFKHSVHGRFCGSGLNFPIVPESRQKMPDTVDIREYNRLLISASCRPCFV